VGKDTKIGLLVGVLVVVLFALVFFGGGTGAEDEDSSDAITREAALGTVGTDSGRADRIGGETADDGRGDDAGGTEVEYEFGGDTGRDVDRTDDGELADTGGRDGADDATRDRDDVGRDRTLDPTPPAASETYEVKSGDCYYTIAKVKYGKASLWPIIRDANEGKDLFPGMKIVIPPKPAERTRTPDTTTPAPPAANEYEVKANDSLWKIAAEQLGNGAKFMLIYEANRDRLTSPEQTLRVGMRLRLPARRSATGGLAASGLAAPRTGGQAASDTRRRPADAVRTARRTAAGRTTRRPSDID